MERKCFKKIKMPDKPGVYFFLDQKNKILYIGKATSLRDRTKSYFSKDLIVTRGPIILDMVFKSKNLKWQETDSVLEALILEANLIKKHQPYYNTKEKDNKSFNYVLITKDVLPKVLIVRGRNLGDYKGFSFGPYTSGSQLKTALGIIRKIFPFVDESSSKKANVEFYKQVHLTPKNTEEYVRNIKNLKLFLRGKKKDVLRNLKKDMFLLAKEKRFEEANELKRQMFALQHVNDIALLKDPLQISPFAGGGNRIEAYDVAHMSGKNMVGVMTVVSDGEVNKSEYKKFKIRTQADANDTGALKEMLERRLAHTEWTYPSLIVLDGGTAQLNTAKNILKNLKLEIPLVSVVKDDKHRAKGIMGDKNFAVKYEREILLANSEAHRFAITYHKQMRGKNFLR